ncbi:hypothetical protein [Massilia glaciei]|nr:hypothetical protein [Massilia glaciei]
MDKILKTVFSLCARATGAPEQAQASKFNSLKIKHLRINKKSGAQTSTI